MSSEESANKLETVLSLIELINLVPLDAILPDGSFIFDQLLEEEYGPYIEPDIYDRLNANFYRKVWSKIREEIKIFPKFVVNIILSLSSQNGGRVQFSGRIITVIKQ